MAINPYAPSALSQIKAESGRHQQNAVTDFAFYLAANHIPPNDTSIVKTLAKNAGIDISPKNMSNLQYEDKFFSLEIDKIQSFPTGSAEQLSALTTLFKGDKITSLSDKPIAEAIGQHFHLTPKQSDKALNAAISRHPPKKEYGVTYTTKQTPMAGGHLEKLTVDVHTHKPNEKIELSFSLGNGKSETISGTTNIHGDLEFKNIYVPEDTKVTLHDLSAPKTTYYDETTKSAGNSFTTSIPDTPNLVKYSAAEVPIGVSPIHPHVIERLTVHGTVGDQIDVSYIDTNGKREHKEEIIGNNSEAVFSFDARQFSPVVIKDISNKNSVYLNENNNKKSNSYITKGNMEG